MKTRLLLVASAYLGVRSVLVETSRNKSVPVKENINMHKRTSKITGNPKTQPPKLFPATSLLSLLQTDEEKNSRERTRALQYLRQLSQTRNWKFRSRFYRRRWQIAATDVDLFSFQYIFRMLPDYVLQVTQPLPTCAKGVTLSYKMEANNARLTFPDSHTLCNFDDDDGNIIVILSTKARRTTSQVLAP